VSAQTPGQSDPERHRFFIDVNFLGTAISAADERTFQYSILYFGELATFRSHNPKPSDDRIFPLVDIGGGVMVNKRFGFGAQFSQTSYNDGAGLEATIPHPFFLNASATGTGQTNSLDRKENALHIFMTLTVLRTRRLEWRFSGGPSFIGYSENLVSEILYSQDATPASPENIVTITGYTTQKVSASTPGIHVSSDFAYDLTRLIALSGTVRASTGTVTIDREPMTQLPQDVRVGSWQILLGVRFRLGSVGSK
jgi:hypothetical protein